MGTASSKSDTLSSDNNLATSPPVKNVYQIPSKKMFEVVDGIKLRNFPLDYLGKNDKVLTISVNNNFPTVLKKLIDYNTGDTNIIKNCSEELAIPYYIVVDKSTNSIAIEEQSDVKNIDKKMITNPILFKSTLDKLLETKNTNSEVLNNTGIYPTLLKNEKAVKAIKQEYDSSCEFLQYFIPLNLLALYSSSSHQNLLIFNKQRKVVTWIEPQYNSELTPYAELIRKTINVILKDIIFHGEVDAAQKAKEYTVDFPTKQCPQDIVKDENCMFWTLLLTMTLIENPKATIDEVSAAYLKKYENNPELLEDLMDSFKGFLYKMLNSTPKGGKVRRTYRKKLKNKHKKTRKVFTSK